MGVFEMVVAVVFISTIGRVAQSFARKRNLAGGEAQLRGLESQILATETRLTQTEEKVADLTEKLEFVENLLAKPEGHSQLPPASRAG